MDSADAYLVKVVLEFEEVRLTLEDADKFVELMRSIYSGLQIGPEPTVTWETTSLFKAKQESA
jgi:hypothetical protein